MTTADQREQALAAYKRLTVDMADWDEGNLSAEQLVDHAFIMVALTPAQLPADLAEIQAQINAEAEADPEHGDYDDPSAPYLSATWRAVERLVAELADLRARPMLTAEEARGAVAHWDEGLPSQASVAAFAKLRAIAEGAGS